jgi:hypothetical protein
LYIRQDKREEREKKTSEAHWSSDYNIISTIKKDLNKINWTIPKQITNSNPNGTYLLSKSLVIFKQQVCHTRVSLKKNQDKGCIVI